jgi:hypothetical protein
VNGTVYISPQGYLTLHRHDGRVLVAKVGAALIEVVVEIDQTSVVSRERTILRRVHMVHIFTCPCVCDNLVIVKVHRITKLLMDKRSDSFAHGY